MDKILYLYGDVNIADLKRVKAERGWDFLVVPKRASPGTPGLDGRVLTTEVPPFACAYGLVRTVEGLAQAAEWCLELVEDRRGRDIASWLTDAIGGKVRELPETRSL